MKFTLYFILSLSFMSFANGQSIKRQSIGTIGKTYQADGITIQQSIGQSFNTQAQDGGNVQPGFIQSTNYATFVSSTFVKQINVYPNPTIDKVNFIVGEKAENVKLKVLNHSGQTIYEEHISSLNTYTLSCLSWSSGIYLLYISDAKGNIYQSKFIKAN